MQAKQVPHDKVPYVTNDPTRHGQGVQLQREEVTGGTGRLRAPFP